MFTSDDQLSRVARSANPYGRGYIYMISIHLLKIICYIEEARCSPPMTDCVRLGLSSRITPKRRKRICLDGRTISERRPVTRFILCLYCFMKSYLIIIMQQKTLRAKHNSTQQVSNCLYRQFPRNIFAKKNNEMCSMTTVNQL